MILFFFMSRERNDTCFDKILFRKRELNLLFIFVSKCNCWKIHEQVLQQPEARSLGGRIIGGITQRLAARLLQQVLRVPAAGSAPSLWQLQLFLGKLEDVPCKFVVNNDLKEKRYCILLSRHFHRLLKWKKERLGI